MSFDDPEYQRYLDEFKARADAASERLSKIHAHDEGLAKGEARGEILGKIGVAQSLLGDPATPRDELLKRPPRGPRRPGQIPGGTPPLQAGHLTACSPPSAGENAPAGQSAHLRHHGREIAGVEP